MNFGSTSPITKLRSNVQWYLDGNTPGPDTVSYVDLYASLKALNASLVTIGKADEKLEKLCALPQRALVSLENLTETQDCLLQLITSGQYAKETSAFNFIRECVIQLVLVAEGRPDLSFRESVLALAKKM